MNRRLTFTFILLALLSIGIAGQALAQTRVPGVKSGDNFKYQVTAHWSSNNVSATVPASMIDINNTDIFEVQVSGTIGANITTTQLQHFKNGTNRPFLVVWNVESGDSYYMQNQFEGIVGANLNVGDRLHPGDTTGNNTLTINSTTTRNYAGGARETNVVFIDAPITNSTVDPATNNTINTDIGKQYVEYYIDKATGVVVEQRTDLESFEPQEKISFVWKLKETNLWDAAPSILPVSVPVFITLVAAIAVIIVAVVVFFLRGRRRRH